MRWQIAIGALLFVAASTEFCLAADPRYPDWPCTQAKVPEISLAAVWAGPPLDDIKDKWKDDAKVSALVPKLAARRTSLEDAQKAITEFLASSATDKATTGKLLFAGLFDTLNAQRASVLNGLERITRKQRDGSRQDPVRCGSHCMRCRARPRPISPRSTSSAINWSGKPGFLRTGSVWSNSSARCPPRSTSGCSRSAA